jgi:hypothetical protein
MLTIKDLETRPEGTFYTGPLDEAKDFIRSGYSVTEQSYVLEGESRFTVLFGFTEDGPVSFDNCNDYGNGSTAEEAWRYALGGEFGPADDEFSAFPLTTNKTEAVRTLVAHHFPKDQRRDVFYSTTGYPHAVVMDSDGNLWLVCSNGTIEVYRS